MGDALAVGSRWVHVAEPPREVLQIELGDRVQWGRPGRRPRWCSWDTWARWMRDATLVEEFPAPEPDLEPPSGVEELELEDLGERDLLFVGVLAPVADGRRLDGQARREWRGVVSECLARGANARQISRATGRPYSQVVHLIAEVRARYAEVSPGIIAQRRESLWWEAHKVAAEALRRLEGVTEVRDATALLRVALEAQKRQAALVGADRGTEASGTSTTVNVAVAAAVDPVALAAKRFGVDVSQLAELGDGLADMLTSRARRVMEDAG